MQFTLERLLEALSWRLAAFFWPIWMIVTVVASITVVLALKRTGISRSVHSNTARPRGIMGGRRVNWTGDGLAPLAILAFFLIGYVALILWGEDFAYYDNSIFTDHTLNGENIELPISVRSGRFFPLGHQEFNFIRHLVI